MQKFMKSATAFGLLSFSTALLVTVSPQIATAKAEAAKSRSTKSISPAKSKASSNTKNNKSAKKEAPMPKMVVNAKLTQKPTPSSFVATRTQRVLTQLKSRPIRTADRAAHVDVDADATKGSWVDAVYSKNMVESSWATEMLSDKRIMAEVLERELGERARAFYPKTMGLREFLSKRDFVNAKGEIKVPGEMIEKALHEEFPAGYVVRAAVGVTPQETGRGMFPDTDQFIVELLKPNNIIYSPVHMKQPVRSHILDAIASGEALVLQENIIGTADAHKPLRNRFFQEVRIHTYESRVVENAVPARWVQTNLLSDDDVARAEAFVGELLQALPASFLNRQAWGVDVAVLDNGDLRIVDVVTNRGKQMAWSGYLDQPRVIGAYTRHFEDHYGLSFKGFSGALIRNNFANYLPYWGKRIEKAKPGMKKALAYLPPIP